MPTFKYLAKKGPSEVIEGLLEAESRANVLNQLIGQGYTPVQVFESSEEGQRIVAVEGIRKVRIRSAELNRFTRQLCSLIRSQVPILRALRVIQDQTSHPRLKKIVLAIEEDIRQGQTLSTALEKYPNIFSSLYVSLIRSGEVGGMLDTVLDRLSLQADREEALEGKIKSALLYPAFVGAVGLGTVLFLLAFVMPRLVKLFANFGSQLPLPTKILLALARWMSNPVFWVLAALVAMGLFSLLRILGERGLLVLDKFLLKLPLIGPMIRQLELARFARSFGLLLDHGVPILRATEISVPVVKHRLIRAQLNELSAQLKDGNQLSSCLKALPVATPFLVNTVAVGEESGKVGEALMEVANFYEREVDRLLGIVATLLEPIMILLVGGIVGFIVMAVLLPVFELSSIIR